LNTTTHIRSEHEGTTMRSSNLFALAASLSTSTAVYQGFNYGATKSDGVTFRYQADFQSLFSTAKNLVGTSGFTSARLYTMIVCGRVPSPKMQPLTVF
jgi:glucan endo-1,3-beta-D-glucosidase